MVRVRFAPSPTGFLHIGGVRTALFNFLYARNQSGKFLLRIEDTDRIRSRSEFEREILESLQWLGLNWDEELVYQSRRLDRYAELAGKWIAEGLAYEDFREGKKAVLFKVPPKNLAFQDIVHGRMEFDTALFGDLVIIKSDGYPTYHFACVVDDHDMEITHVIRGDDHLSNTPRQILLYEAFGWKPPKYAHLPLIAGPDGTPLSKRHGAVAVSFYRTQGYLPEGLLNFLALLGWGGGGNEEIFTLAELCKKFSLKKVNKAKAAFNPEKLLWLNAQHIKRIPEQDYLQRLTSFYPEEAAGFPGGRWRKLALLYRPRIQNFSDLKSQEPYLFDEVQAYGEAECANLWANHAVVEALKEWFDKTGPLPDFDSEAELEKMTRNLAEARGMTAANLIHPLRFILTGKTVSPGLFELMSVLGKEKCRDRIHAFLEKKVATAR